MNAPVRLYWIILGAGLLGMIAGGLAMLLFETRSGSSFPFVVPWIMAAVIGVNLGYREGIKAATARKSPSNEGAGS